MDIIPSKIRTVRLDLMLNEKEVAQEIGLNESDYMDFENNKKELSSETLFSLLDFLGLELKDVTKQKSESIEYEIHCSRVQNHSEQELYAYAELVYQELMGQMELYQASH